MKKLALALALTTAAGSLGCETAVDLGNRPRFSETNYSLTILAYDGITGEKITNAEVTARVGPYTFTADKDGNAYTFQYMNNGVYPIFIRADGYLGFTSTNYSFNQIYDTRTVQLFKKQSVATDLTIKVYSSADGSPVSGGQVLVNITSLASVYTDTRQLTGTFQEMPTIFTVPLSNGTASILKEQLVFGATYEVDVIGATNADGKYLRPEISNSAARRCQVGFEYQQVNIFMGPIAETPMAVRTNIDADASMNVDNLVVNFPYPIERCGTSTPSLSISPGYDADGDTIRTLADPTDPVTVALSEGDTVLTLTPKFSPRDSAGEDLQVTFNNVFVQVKGTTGCTNLTYVPLRDSSSDVNTTIDMQD